MAGRPQPPADSPVREKLGRVFDETAATTTSLLPYRDFACQYPPLAVIYFWGIGKDRSEFLVSFSDAAIAEFGSLMVAIVVISYRSVAAMAGRPSHACFPYLCGVAIVVAAIGPRWLCFYDALPALCVSIVLRACLCDRWVVAGAALAAGVLLKIYPAFLAPVLLIWAYQVGGKKAVVSFLMASIGVGVVIVSPWLIASPTSLLGGIQAQAGRQFLEYGSFLGSLLVIARTLGLASFGAELDSRVLLSETSRLLAQLSPVLMLTFVAIASALFDLRLRRDKSAPSLPRPSPTFVRYVLLIHVVILTTSSVFSPQYVLWLLPVVLPFMSVSRWVVALYVAACLCIQIQHPIIEGLPPAVKEICLAVIFGIRDVILMMFLVVCERTKTSQNRRLTQVFRVTVD